MKRNYIFCIVLFFCVKLNGQERAIFYGAKSHYGFIIPHSPELKPISKTNPYGLQLEISHLKTSDKAWKTCFCYGRTGVSFAFFNYANPQVLGNSYNLNYFVEPYFTYRGPLKLSLRGSVGATYLDQIFDEVSNPENVLFSTRLSFYLALSLNLNYHLNDTYTINFSGHYNHISNGGQKKPNKGINFPTFSIGVDRIINNTPLTQKPKEPRAYNKVTSYYIGSFASLSSAEEESESTNHFIIGGFGKLLKPVSVINGLNLGVEFWYDYAAREQIQLQNINESAFFSSVTAGHHFSIGNFYFLQQFGIYTIRPKTIENKWLYQRYSLWYRFGKRWGIGGSLIAYGKVADHLDARLLFLLD